MTKRQKKQKTASEIETVVAARIPEEPEPTDSLVLPVYYRIYGLERDNRTVRAVLPIDKLKVEASMDMLDFLDAVEQRVQTVSRLIRADTNTIYRGGVRMDSSVLDSRTTVTDPLILVLPAWIRVVVTHRLLTYPLTWRAAIGNTLVDGSNLAFVNRTRAMVELLEVHQRNFDRTIHKHGCSKVTPFLDNLEGKWLLVDKYVSECWKYFHSCATTPQFQESILNARTICLKFQSGQLLKALNEHSIECEAVIAKKLITWIVTCPHIIGSTERVKACSESTAQPSVGAIQAFIRETDGHSLW